MGDAVKNATTHDDRSHGNRPRVLIIGGGFAGLHAARGLAKLPVDVALVDRCNHHTFQPLLYQVALGILSPAHIAQPLRGLLRNSANVNVLMDEAIGFDLPGRCVSMKNAGLIHYDYLVVAAGATHSYFGMDGWARLAPGLKTVNDAVEIRSRLIMAFEAAEVQMLKTGSHRPLIFAVIGGGPIGVELAGAISDITKNFMNGAYRRIDPAKSKVLIFEGGPRILPAYPEDLSQKAVKQLENLGVEIHTNARVTDIQDGYLMVSDQRIDTTVTLWGAGVRASALGKLIGTELDKQGRVMVNEYLNPDGSNHLFVCGDMASVVEAGRQIPGVVQPAMQMGDHVAKMIGQDLAAKPRTPFHYLDKCDISTIGRYAAVANIKWPFRAHWSGIMAWLSWVAMHLFSLISFRNRTTVMREWLYSMVTASFGACLITGDNAVPDMTGPNDSGSRRDQAHPTTLP